MGGLGGADDSVKPGTCPLGSVWSFLKTKSGLLVLFQQAELKVQGTIGSHRNVETQAIMGPPSVLYLSGASGTEDWAIPP